MWGKVREGPDGQLMMDFESQTRCWLFHPCRNPIRKAIPVSPFYRWGHRGSKTFSGCLRPNSQLVAKLFLTRSQSSHRQNEQPVLLSFPMMSWWDVGIHITRVIFSLTNTHTHAHTVSLRSAWILCVAWTFICVLWAWQIDTVVLTVEGILSFLLDISTERSLPSKALFHRPQALKTWLHKVKSCNVAVRAPFNLLWNAIKNWFCLNTGLGNGKGLLGCRCSWWTVIALGNGVRPSKMEGSARGESLDRGWM